MEQPNGEPAHVLLKDLPKDYYRLQFLVNQKDENLRREEKISMQAGELVGKLYDALLAQYIDHENEHSLKSLNALCVRLVFCLYAEDAGLFASHSAFHDYLKNHDKEDVRKALIELFCILDTKPEDRDPYERSELLAFPYVNGGLFADENIEIPRFNDEILALLLNDCSAQFDWADISPTIFGAVFESTLNPETRRSGGMHYTSIENIHKVTDPLFLNSLTEELDGIIGVSMQKGEMKKNSLSPKKVRQLRDYQDKLASLTFFDPACGSGNFLTETFLSLRRLENRVLKALRSDSQLAIGGDFSPIKVSIQQFYGIEINDFAATVAKTALWIAEHQMMQETADIVGHDLDFLPLKTYTHITEGNALRIDWNDVVPADKVNYIMGNPPFVGARVKSENQKNDVIYTFGEKWKNVGNLDYVCCWYKKATDFIQNTYVRAALVSTNSICQGEQVTNLWKPLFEQGVHIDFAYHTFQWDSEASLKAHVHCVIVGFSVAPNNSPKIIFDNDNYKVAKNINAYLYDNENIFIEKRSKPISKVPDICLGGQPIDDGNLILTQEEKDDLLKKEPQAECFIRRFMMGQDFINRNPRYCLWLKGANPAILRTCKLVIERIENVRKFRLSSNRTSTLKAADTPAIFGAPFECDMNYIALPKVSSERRRYIPIDYLNKDIIPGDKLFVMQNATIYHFGILTSNVHMAWTRAFCGRLKSDYSYSNTIVYNNFPWPSPTEAQRAKIERTAQAILDARGLYPDCSLADLYDEVTMPIELRKAHQANDRAVMEAYGFTPVGNYTESDCVAELMKMYQKLVGK